MSLSRTTSPPKGHEGEDAPIVSIGVAITAGSASYGSILRCADRALYQAKRGGRNRLEEMTLAFTGEAGTHRSEAELGRRDSNKSVLSSGRTIFQNRGSDQVMPRDAFNCFRL